MLMRNSLLENTKKEGKPIEYFQSNKDTKSVKKEEDFKSNSTANFINKNDGPQTNNNCNAEPSVKKQGEGEFKNQPNTFSFMDGSHKQNKEPSSSALNTEEKNNNNSGIKRTSSNLQNNPNGFGGTSAV